MSEEEFLPAAPRNPFGSAPVAARPDGAVARTDQQRAVAEVQAAMMIARANPRDPIVAMDRILNACTRPTLAQAALYSYARGGSDITGPSIRLAEAMAQVWGNLQFGIREVEQRNGESTVEAYCWDVETNVRREVKFQVPHVRHTRQGSKRLEDPRDVYELVANQGARRLRACILAVIPGDVTEAAVEQCEDTTRATADTSPEAIQKLVGAFDDFGVTKEQLEKRIQRRLDSIQPAQVVSLRKIYRSLLDNMSVPGDWFEPVEAPTPQQAEGAQPVSAAERAKDTIRRRQKPAAEAPPPAAEEKPQPDPAAKAEKDPPMKRTYAQFVDLLKAAKPEARDALLAEAKAELAPEFFDELVSIATGGLL